MTTIADIHLSDILSTVFQTAACDFCPASNILTYSDPETQGRYCLPCLVQATDPLPELPEDPEVTQMGRDYIAAHRIAA